MDARALRLEVLNLELTLFERQLESRALPRGKLVPVREDIEPDHALAPFLKFRQLPLEAKREVLQPAGKIEIILADALDSSVLVGAVAVIVLAQREQALEIVPAPVHAEHG